MTRRQKVMLVELRLKQDDAAGKSDRALARELGVSQPFVGKQRRRLSMARPHRKDNRNRAAAVLVEHTTTAQQALEQFHDQWSAIGGVRRVSWPVNGDNSRARRDKDPYD